MIIPVKHSALAMQSFLKDAVQGGVAHQILGNNSATIIIHLVNMSPGNSSL